MNAAACRFLQFAVAFTGLIGSATAENLAFNNGDLILGFQATSGTGSDKNVFFVLGSGVSFRDNGNQGLKGNIAATLSSVYGFDWYTRTDLYFGVIGNLNYQPTSGVGSRTPVNGDPSRTFYSSTPAANAGGGTLFAASAYPSAALGTAGSSLAGLESMIVTLTANGDGAAVLDQSTKPTEWQNGWTIYNPTPGAAFNTFTGIQQSFGKTGSATYVDVQRVLATNTGAVPAGTVGGGTYETTIAIASDGSITSTTASAPVSPFNTWALSYPALDTPEKRLSNADPDHDGMTNLAEFAFGGNPTSGSNNGTRNALTTDANNDLQRDLTLTIEVRAGANFSADGNDQIATIDGITYRIEGSTDLVTFDSQVIEVTPHLGTGSPASGYVFKTFRLTASSGLLGKGFLRASVQQ